MRRTAIYAMIAIACLQLHRVAKQWLSLDAPHSDKNVKFKNYAAFPHDFTYVFNVKIIVCNFVIEMEMIDM